MVRGVIFFGGEKEMARQRKVMNGTVPKTTLVQQ